jgi:hypothetical protein
MSLGRVLAARTLKIFGDIKVYPFPMWLLYDPGSYRLRGEDVRDVITLAQPGDILLRGYVRYLDGYFIPGIFSHAGLFLGPVGEGDRATVVSTGGSRRFRAGAQMVAHSMAEGVFLEDVLTFCRCDYMVILRFPAMLRRRAGATPLDVARSEYDELEQLITSRLERDEEVPFTEVWPVIRQVALRNVGREYDFSFDFRSFERLSCTEFVYLCTKSLAPFMQIRPELRRVFVAKRLMIVPDAFLGAGLQTIWASRSTREKLGVQLAPEAAMPPEGALAEL